MVNIKYANAYSEILEILKYIPIEDYNKIPQDKIELFKENANNDYLFKYNPSKTLEEQNVSNITKGIIILLFRDYWATEIQRNSIIAKQNYDRMNFEEEKNTKYNSNNIFKDNKKNIIVDNIENKQEVALVETKNMKWYKKIGKFLIKFLK